jgi:peptidoglycan/LPS O-acetylase OafA/YrhL
LGTKSNTHWVRGIDSIRIVLALIVLLSHLENQFAIFLKTSDNTIIYLFGVGLNHAFLGPGAVTAFFIISGFVIHYPFKDREPNVRQFLIRRWVRIVLPLLVAVAIAIYLEGLWLVPIWSLYCELIYYTIYPVLRRLPISWKTQFVITFVIAAIIVFTMGGDELTSLLTQTNVNYTGSYAVLGDWITWIIGLPCWLIGVLIAENIDKIKKVITRPQVYLIRCAMILLAMVIVGLKAHWYTSYLFTLNFIAPIIGLWITAEIIYFRDHQPWAWLEYGGKFSYSLYLCHIINLVLIEMVMKPTVQTYLVIIVINVFLAWLFYLVVEEPSHRLSRYLASKA